MPGSDESTGTVEKLMSIRLDEFEAGLVRLNRNAMPDRDGTAYVIPVADPDDGLARIVFEKLPPAVLGGLMRLPRARIVIDLLGVRPVARQPFRDLFDRTFQRGGG
ncbi:MAG TPA: hypothetical protein VMX97_01190 [Hyphomicrobiaceae bacterium]|nr:hypothetical protein [Hyphomicrobiaceae bacterium]